MEELKLINFVDLSYDDLQMVLSWRNHPNIRQWMHNSNKIEINEHLKFVKSLKNHTSKHYFLVKENDEYIGVVYLHNDYLGIYANPDKKRVGDLLLRVIIDFSFNTKKLFILKAEVYKTNQKAIELYKRHQFEIKEEKEDLFVMELKNEK